MKPDNEIRATGAMPNLEAVLDFFGGIPTRIRAKKKLSEILETKAGLVQMRNMVNRSIEPATYFSIDVKINHCDREIRLLKSILNIK